MNNEDEFTFGYNPISASSFGAPSETDTDGDGVSDAVESVDLDPGTPGVQNPFDAFLGDTTGNNGANSPDGVADGQNDYDGDGLSNLVESVFGINPLLFDTDGDGFGDGGEVAAGTGVLNAASFPPTDIMWIDFAAIGPEAGIETHPFNTLTEVITLIDSGGTINIKGDTADAESAETPTIDKAMTIQSVNGIARIGVTAP